MNISPIFHVALLSFLFCPLTSLLALVHLRPSLSPIPRLPSVLPSHDGIYDVFVVEDLCTCDGGFRLPRSLEGSPRHDDTWITETGFCQLDSALLYDYLQHYSLKANSLQLERNDGIVVMKKDTGEFTLELEDPPRYVPWSSVDPYPSAKDREREMAKYSLYFNGPKPFAVTVKAGEILYLPSMWFHHVRQSPDSRGRTIAINYWYDMQFDIKYAYFNFLQSIPYPSSHDQTKQNMICLGSSSDSFITEIGEEQGTALAVDDSSESGGE